MGLVLDPLPGVLRPLPDVPGNVGHPPLHVLPRPRHGTVSLAPGRSCCCCCCDLHSDFSLLRPFQLTSQINLLSSLSMKSPSCSHHDLPTDVLHSIQKRLPLDDYFRFAAVCNSWRFAAKQNPYLSKPDEIPWLFLFHYLDDDFANAIRFSPQNNSRCKIYEIPVPKSFRGYEIISSVGRHLILRKMCDKSSGFFLVNPFNWTQIGCLPSAISFSCPLHRITPFPLRRPTKIVTDGSTAVALFPFTPAYTTLGSDTWIGLHETLTNSMDFLDVIAVCGKPGVFYIAKTASFCDVVVGALHFDFSSSHRNVVSWVDMTLNLRKDYISKEDTSLVTEEGSLKELEIFVDVRLVISSSNLFLVRWRLILTKDEMKRREVVVYKLLDDDTNQRKRWVLAETLGTCSFFIGHNQTISLSSPKLRSNCIYFSYYPYLPAKNDYWPDHGSDFEHCWIYNLGDGSWEQLYDVDDQFYSYMMYASASRTVWITPCLDNRLDLEGASNC